MKDEYEQAMNQAMYYLGVRARTVKQMEDYLIKKQHDEHTIARVMEKLIEYGLLDDEQYAQRYVQTRKDTSGKYLLRQKMKMQGLSSDVIDEAVGAIPFEDQVAAARALIDRKMAGDEREDALRRANIRFGLVTVEQRGLKARELTLDEIPQGRVKDYLMASAACFPALRAREIDGVKFLDGGYSDNMPTGLAKKMGADELVCVDLEGVGITRPNLTGLPTTMVRSYWELGDILHFDPDTARRNVELGYYDTLRAFGRVRGCAYAVDNGPDSSADAAAFRARFDAVQKAVREKYPVTLTADAALLLARMKDAELAPLEAVAEDVGVDPTVYYTTRTLGQAFLDKCDRARMAGFAPLFAGSADAGRAALAALLPNTFLQALVWQALTAPELPEVTEHEDL